MTEPARTTRELKADHCPDCGGPLVITETGQRGCCLCGTFAEPPRPPRPR